MTKPRISTKKLVVLALLSAIGYISMFLLKIPVVGFLKYEPKDIFIALAGMMYGPYSALAVSAVTAVLELPISSTGVIGMVMNLLSSASFACTVALIYHKKETTLGAVLGFLGGMAAMTTTMLLWNYLISPLYMGVTREEIVPLLTSMFLPFNLLKSGINAAAAMMLYRPFMKVLVQCGFRKASAASGKKGETAAVYAICTVILVGCGVIVWRLNQK